MVKFLITKALKSLIKTTWKLSENKQKSSLKIAIDLRL